MSLAYLGLEPLAALAWTSGHSGPGKRGGWGLGETWLPGYQPLEAPSLEDREQSRAQG